MFTHVFPHFFCEQLTLCNESMEIPVDFQSYLAIIFTNEEF